MPAYALLEPNVQELLENDRTDYLTKRIALLKQTKQEIALASLIGVARETLSQYPNVRYVNLVMRSNAITDGIVQIHDVFDVERNVLAEEPHRGLCMAIEKLFWTGDMGTFSPLETGEYDFVELADRQI